MHKLFNTLSNSKRLLTVLLPCLSALFVTSTWGSERTLTVGGYYSRGDYGKEATTQIWSVPLSIKYKNWPWTAKATWSYIGISGPGNINTEGRYTLDALRSDGEYGLGDIYASLGYAFPRRRQLPLLEVTGKLKLPIADSDKGLGTGQRDVELIAEASKVLLSTNYAMAVGYKWRGDPPDIALRNTAAITISAARNISSLDSLGGSFNFRQASVASNPAQKDFTLFYTRRQSPSRSFTLYGIKGFSMSSPDLAIGFQLAWRKKTDRD